MNLRAHISIKVSSLRKANILEGIKRKHIGDQCAAPVRWHSKYQQTNVERFSCSSNYDFKPKKLYQELQQPGTTLNLTVGLKWDLLPTDLNNSTVHPAYQI
ncbi:hypothetical protein O181_101090 [Austropuccinia psidii MF-1]|uniref:Uncharacterized protein n=1 Tax=Austropuccinia psidii MF-1 TaxID=1389203 RepID=A0A9Q3JDT8_9BASI|nr:hypothetical protein [Austropuccinia psidii MF-1]